MLTTNNLGTKNYTTILLNVLMELFTSVNNVELEVCEDKVDFCQLLCTEVGR